MKQKLLSGGQTGILFRIIKFMILLLGLLFFYVVFLVIGQAIPRSLVEDNARKSYEQLEAQGLYFEVVDGANWDNLTDAFFINAAVTEYDGNLVEKALANAYTTTDEKIGWQSIIDSIQYAIDGNVHTIIEPYSRYWVGMLTIYKLLLIFMPISGIRTLVFGIVVILFAITVLNVYKMLGRMGLLPFLASVTLALYMPQAICLVFSTDIITMLLMMNICYIMLKRDTSSDIFYLVFFLAGSILAYLNYWAFPLITLGFPLVFMVTVKLIRKYNIKALIKETVLISLSWGAGLAGTILVKQILCKIVLGTQTGTGQLLFRLGSGLSIADRFVSVINGLAKQISSPPIFIMTIVVVIWGILLLKTGCLQRKYQCFLLVLIAFYPMAWWFLLANHSAIGFVSHMYGVTYYALLSALLMSCERWIPSLHNLRNITGKKVAVNMTLAAIWLVLSYIFLSAAVHYGTKETEPWSLETVGTVNLGENAVMQEVSFDELVTGKAYLKSISTILVNISDDNKEGALHVELAENGNILSAADVSIADIQVGEWFEVPMHCMIYQAHKYQISYSVKDTSVIEPYLLVQDDAQAARENGTLYVGGNNQSGSVANKYEYDEYILSTKAKAAALFILLFILQYILFLWEEKIDLTVRHKE